MDHQIRGDVAIRVSDSNSGRGPWTRSPRALYVIHRTVANASPQRHPGSLNASVRDRIVARRPAAGSLMSPRRSTHWLGAENASRKSIGRRWPARQQPDERDHRLPRRMSRNEG